MKRKILVLTVAVMLSLCACNSEGENKEVESSQIVETTKDVEPTIEAVVEPIVEQVTTEVELTTEATTAEPSTTGDSINADTDLTIVENFEQQYCTITEIEPKTMYAIEVAGRYINPNQYEGNIELFGSIEKGAEIVVDGTTEYKGIQYYTITNGLNEVYLIKVDSLSDTKPLSSTTTGNQTSTGQMTADEQAVANGGFTQAEIDAFREMGMSDEEIAALIGNDFVTSGSASDYQYQEGDTSGWSDNALDILKQIDGKTTN